MIRRRHRPTSPAPPLDNDDLLSEILLRLPPLPSSLPRASLVCIRWRRLVSDRGFLRRFRARHRKPPLLGVIQVCAYPIFAPALDPPDRIPAARFSWRLDNRHDLNDLLGVRHGRALVHVNTCRYSQRRLIVWDPVAGDRRAVAIPGGFRDRGVVVRAGEVRCVAGDGDPGHVHGGCHSSPFEVVILGTNKNRTHAFACVYSSETGIWGNVISAAVNFGDCICNFTTLVGNSLYCLLLGEQRTSFFQFDLDKQITAQIDVPPDMHPDGNGHHRFGDTICRFAPAENGGLLFHVVTHYTLNVWKSETNADGVAGWVLEKTIELDRLLSLEPGPQKTAPMLLGFSEEHNVAFVCTYIGVSMIHLESMEFKSVSQRMSLIYHPFTSFYTKELSPH
ncbi:hypothetical protein EE612_049959 [Oryza sativa]|nr:hypothetical protein EE612_049959 [Oryza sativa]